MYENVKEGSNPEYRTKCKRYNLLIASSLSSPKLHWRKWTPTSKLNNTKGIKFNFFEESQWDYDNNIEKLTDVDKFEL